MITLYNVRHEAWVATNMTVIYTSEAFEARLRNVYSGCGMVSLSYDSAMLEANQMAFYCFASSAWMSAISSAFYEIALRL